MLKLLEVQTENVTFEVMAKIILSVTNDLVTDQRVHKVATTLMNHGASVLLVGRKLKNSLPVNRSYHTHRMRLFFNKGPFFYGEYNIRLFLFLLFSKVDVLVANDLDTLLANFLTSKLRNKKLVYDTHEYFCGVPELQNRPVVQKIWRFFERGIFPFLTDIYTVNESIAHLYKNEYKKELRVVRNVPERISWLNWQSRTDLGLPVDKKIILMQGAGINIQRGAEEVMEALKNIPDVLFLIVGGGDVIPMLKSLSASPELKGKIMFKPKMPYKDMMCFTHLADLGLSLDKDTNINYRYSLPNKLFDYVQAEIPILCTDLVEVARVVRGWDIGSVINDLQPDLLKVAITEALYNEKKRETWKNNLKHAAKELCWENESEELMKIYSKYL